MEDEKWYCMKCARQLVQIQLDEGPKFACLDCKVMYTIHGTGAEGSLFVAGCEVLQVKF